MSEEPKVSVTAAIMPEEATSFTSPMYRNDSQRPLNLLPLEKRVPNTGIPPLAMLEEGERDRWETALRRSAFWLSAGFFAGLSRAWWNDVHEIKYSGWGGLRETWSYFKKQVPRPLILFGLSGTIWSLSYAGIEELTGKKNLLVPGVLAGTVWGLACKEFPVRSKAGSAVLMSLAIVGLTTLFQNKARENGRMITFSQFYRYTNKIDMLPVFEDKPALPAEPKNLIISFYCDETGNNDPKSKSVANQ